MEQKNETELTIWKNETSLTEIRKCFAPKVNEIEWQTFLALGQATGLNPFLREMWCIKYSERDAAQIFISRDGYRKAAQCQAEYDYHVCDAVYSNDKFIVKDGIVHHMYEVTNRGNLIGAYCTVQRKTSSMPMFIYVEAKEYLKHMGVWKEKPATMLKKVAEAQALRMAFQNVFVNTYSEFEQWKREEIERTQHLKVVNQLPPSALQTIDVSAPFQDEQFKEYKTSLAAEVFATKTVERLKALWQQNEEKIMAMSEDERLPIIRHFNARKTDLHEEANKNKAS